jgi:hypothetical protein
MQSRGINVKITKGRDEHTHFARLDFPKRNYFDIFNYVIFMKDSSFLRNLYSILLMMFTFHMDLHVRKLRSNYGHIEVCTN